MAQWKVSTREKKSVEEHEMWEKDGQTIVRVSGFRWGTWTVTTDNDEPPDFERTVTPGGTDDLDSVDMYNNGYDTELEMLDDGWYGDVIWPEDMDQEERERLEELWEEDAYEAWEDAGWMQTDTECWAWGEFDIERLED